MKQRSFSPLLLILAAIFIVTGCSTGISLQKRKYNKGYHLAFHKKQHKAEEHQSQRKDPAIHEIKDDTKVPLLIAGKGAKGSAQQATPFKPAEKQKIINQGSKLTASADENLLQEAPVIRDVELKDVNRESTPPKNDLDPDVKLIILLILAILLPPLAVYLKDHATSKWFWITLILSLLAFFGVFFYYAWLFWLAAIIIAVLYVLNEI
jgi:uncharacterized membrane protein YqaE (UPF0057 family)